MGTGTRNYCTLRSRFVSTDPSQSNQRGQSRLTIVIDGELANGNEILNKMW
jgi:hypothetical protein